MGLAGNVASHWWIILIIVVIIFGASRLPALARSVGQSVNILKSEVKGGQKPADDPDDTAASPDRK